MSVSKELCSGGVSARGHAHLGSDVRVAGEAGYDGNIDIQGSAHVQMGLSVSDYVYAGSSFSSHSQVQCEAISVLGMGRFDH